MSKDDECNDDDDDYGNDGRNTPQLIESSATLTYFILATI